MSVLVDTSVWVAHFKQRSEALVSLMLADLALTHPMVLVELACGTPPGPRERTLADIALLQSARQATLKEVMALIEREKLFGLGCGLVDISLLASTLVTPGAQLWTLDKRLSDLAERFGVGYQPSVH
jgi:predicted nucleic acid-binding protein